MQATPSSVFITGATGFIGQRLLSRLPEKGFAVRAMIRPDKTKDSRITHRCDQVPVGLTDVEKLADILTGSDAVIYCAGSVRGRRPSDFAGANIRGVKALLDALERVDKPPPLLLISSLAASRPQLSDYARSKREGEQLLLGRPSLPWTILRPPAVYGPGDREMLPLLKMARRGLLVHAGPRDQKLSLLHVDDLATAVVAWLESWPRTRHNTYAIDDGRAGGYDWPAIGDAVGGGRARILKLPRFLLMATAKTNLLLSSVLGYAPMLTPGKVLELIQPGWLCDNREFTRATGWVPEFDLNRGVRQLFESREPVIRNTG